MHPYLTERMLRQSPSLAPLGAIAGQMGERLDGSGYPSGAHGAQVSCPAHVLAAADAYRLMREPRPYREALGLTRPRRSSERTCRRDGSTATRSSRCWERRAIA